MVSIAHLQIIVKSNQYNNDEMGFGRRFITMKSKLRHILAINIRNHRQLLGFSQAKLAEHARIAPAYVAMIELEKKFPSDQVLERIAIALKIDPTELFSTTCYPVEEIRNLQKSVLEGIVQVVNTQITKFETKCRG
jgi:transcriptional regulator with XRE-family HTH domain